jgi:hypothetical protein
MFGQAVMKSIHIRFVPRETSKVDSKLFIRHAARCYVLLCMKTAGSEFTAGPSQFKRIGKSQSYQDTEFQSRTLGYAAMGFGGVALRRRHDLIRVSDNMYNSDAEIIRRRGESGRVTPCKRV